MLPLIVAGAMAAMSVAGSAASNKANAKSFVENTEQIKYSLNKQWGQLQEQAQAANDNVSLEMASNRFNGLKTTASTTNMIAEKEIAGNTAMRAYSNSKMVALMSHNVLAKKAEDTMTNFGVEMENARDKANQAIYSGGAVAASNTKGTAAVLSSAVSAGMQGYMMGGGVSSFLGSGTTGMGSVAGGAGGFSSYEAAASGNYTGGF